MRVFPAFLVLAVSLFGGDKGEAEYQQAMLYFNGEKGVAMMTKVMPNCPYEKCSEVSNKDGTHTFSYLQKDLKSGMKHMRKAIDLGNVNAARETVRLLQRRLNWREPKMDGYLLARLKDDLGMDANEYRRVFLRSADLLRSKNDCEGLSLYGDLKSGGLLGVKRDPAAGVFYYKKAAAVCPKDSYVGLIAAQKSKGG